MNNWIEIVNGDELNFLVGEENGNDVVDGELIEIGEDLVIVFDFELVEMVEERCVCFIENMNLIVKVIKKYVDEC